MHDTGEKLTFWRESCVTQALLREASEALLSVGIERRGSAQESLILKALSPDADVAYQLGHDAPDLGIEDDEARTWLWFAASHHHASAARQLAGVLKAEAVHAPAKERVHLCNLANGWFASAAVDDTGSEAQEFEREFQLLEGVKDPTGLLLDLPPASAAPPETPVSGRMVVAGIGDPTSKEGVDLGKRFGAVVGKVLPYRGRVPEPGEIRAGILARWPWAERAADVIENHFAVARRSRAEGVRVPNLLLVGNKGCGKSSMARWICEVTGLAHTMIPCGGVSDAAGLTPVTRAWATTRPGAIFQAMARHGVCNPALILDEIDKTTQAGASNGSVTAALLSMVGEETFEDGCLMATVDVSRVSYVATANDDAAVDEFLRDRFEVVRIPSPRDGDLPVLHASAVADFARRRDIPERDLPVLGEAERRALAALFVKRGRSARAYYLMLESRLSKAIAEEERRDLAALQSLESPSTTMH